MAKTKSGLKDSTGMWDSRAMTIQIVGRRIMKRMEYKI